MKGTVLYQAYMLMSSHHHLGQQIKSIHSVELPVPKVFIHWMSGETDVVFPQYLRTLAEFICRDTHWLDFESPEVPDDALDVKWRNEETGAWMCIKAETHEVLQWTCDGWRNENEDIERIYRRDAKLKSYLWNDQLVTPRSTLIVHALSIIPYQKSRN